MTDIMLVDDEVLALEYLKNMVDWERNGYHVVGCATSGKKALELFDRTHPQIVISDIRMPGTDGLELTRQIKEKDKETVVILLSAYRDFDYAQKGIRYGVSNYLLKHELSSELILKELEEVKEKLERAGNKKKIYQKLDRRRAGGCAEHSGREPGKYCVLCGRCADHGEQLDFTLPH